MEYTYDAIVIGAGNGGMTGALTLARAGKKVALLEQHSITGGCGSSFMRGRFEFETGLHQLYGIGDSFGGEKGALRKVFEELEVWDDITFVKQEEAFRLAFKDMGEIALPNTRDEFVQDLQDYFGTEAEAIAEYQELVEKAGLEFMRLYSFVAENKPVTQEEFPVFYEYGACTGEYMLNKYFENAMLKGVYQCLYGYLGIPIERIPFMVLAALYEREGGTWNVHETSMAMSNAITNAFIDQGGTLKLNTRVERILIEDNAVTGVITNTGDVYYANIVLCNANRINAYVDMIDNQLVPESMYEDLRVSSVSQSIIGITVGLDCTPEEAGIVNATNFLMPKPGGPKRRYDVNLRQLEYVPLLYVSCYDLDDPDYGPEGTSTITILTSKLSDPFELMPPEEYHDAKFAYIELMLDYLDDFYPKIREHIEEIDSFTPMTIMRYIGSQSGAIYGVDSHIKDLMATKLDARSPFEGLYFCGATMLFGGFHTTLISGNATAKLILKDLDEGVVRLNNDFTKMKDVEGILEEIRVTKLYNLDHRIRKGRIRKSVNKLHPDSIDFYVHSIIDETPSAKTFRLAAVGGYLPPFVPGQYISLNVEVNGICTSRAYSISSSSTQRDYYDITVRRSNSGFVSHHLLDAVKEGDTLTGSGPFGQFYPYPSVHGNRLCFIAGGSGITPFMSMLATDAERKFTDKDITLFYGCAKETDIIFKERLRALTNKLPGLKLIPVISEPGDECSEKTGFITAELLQDTLGNLDDVTFFLCGPKEMYNFLDGELEKLGIKGRKIRREVQSAPAKPWMLDAWPKEVSPDDLFKVTLSDGRELEARAGWPLLSSLEAAGVIKKSQCRSGDCAACRSRLTQGKVFQAETANVRKSDMRYGYIHPCVSYPISDLTLMI